MYEKLLLNCDGGIISETSKFEQDNCAVVAIGLGGTGIDCLKNLKAKVYNRIKSDNDEEGVLIYSHIKFLAVDTDKTGLNKKKTENGAEVDEKEISRLDVDKEFFDISNSSVTDLFKNGNRLYSDSDVYKDWLEYEKITSKGTEAGASGVRQIGRFLLMERANEFVSRVQNLVRQAKEGLVAPDVYIHIFTGLGGGTGAGTFLDICYLVRKALENDRANTKICGYFFLPDINLSQNLTEQTKSYIQINGYASMQELDYCMNFERNGDKWSQKYRSIGLVESQEPPVDLCHLVSGTNERGDVIQNAYKYAMNVVTDYFMDFVIRTGQEFTLKSAIANYDAVLGQVYKDRGAQYDYCVLGAAAATLPIKEAITYLASEMFGKFSNVKKNTPTNAQVQEFVQSNRLQPQEIYSQLTQGINWGFAAPDVDWKSARTDTKLVVGYYDQECKATAYGLLERNSQAMSRSLDNYFFGADGNAVDAQSSVSQLFKALRSICLDPKKGPFFAASLLRAATGAGIIDTLRGYAKDTEEKLGHENYNESKFRKEYETAQEDFVNNANLFNGKKKYERWVNASRNLTLLYTKAESYRVMIALLATVVRQLEELDKAFSSKLKNVMDELISTFDANRNYLISMVDDSVGYEIPLVRIQELKGTLDATVKEINMENKFADFMAMMLSEEGVNAWMSDNKNKLTIAVTKYFSALFSDYSNKSMADYLKEKYSTEDSNVLIQKIRDDIMAKLDSMSSPLYWSTAYYNVNEASTIGYITVPRTCAEVVSAASNLIDAKGGDSGGWTTRPAEISNRMSIYRCAVGVPVFGYCGASVYERNSCGSPNVGKHLYEGKSYMMDKKIIFGKDWRELPSPIPFSLMDARNDERLVKIATKAKDTYKKAERIGIIDEIGANEYAIKLIDDSFITDMKTIYEGAITKGDVDKLVAKDQLENLRKNIKYIDTTLKIENDAKVELDNETKRRVRIDHFTRAPKLVEATDEALNKMDTLDKWIAELEPKIDNEFEDFMKAICVGIIKLNGPIVEYEDNYGEKMELSHPRMERGGAPLYQALLTYKGLASNIKENISKATTEILENYPLPENVVEATRNVKAEFTPENVKNMNSQAVRFPEGVKAIREFIDQVKNDDNGFIKKFTVLYRIAI